MIASKELLSLFKSAAWSGPGETEAFVAAASPAPPADLLKLLEVLAGKAPEPAVARLRLTVFGKLVELAPDKSLFIPLVKALKLPDPGLRTALAALIPKVNSPTEHAALVEHLRSAEPPLRKLAAAALLQIGGGKTIFELLTRAAGEKDFAGGAEALEVLVGFARHLAVPALQGALAAGSQSEKILALRYLGDAKAMAKDPASALKAIVPALDGQPEPVVGQAIASFSALCTEDDWFEYVGRFLDHGSVPLVKAAVDGLRRFSSMRVIGALERKLRAGPRAIRLSVLSCLEVIATDDVLPALVTALSNQQIQVRTKAGEVLAQLSLDGKLDVSRTVIWLLRSRDVNVRRMATEIIRNVKDPDQTLWPRLMGFLRDEDWWVRERVMDALIELGSVSLTAHMVGMLTDKSEIVRRFAVNVLARLKDPKSLRSLVQVATSDPDWWVKETAIEAVAIINDPRAIPYLVHILGADAEMQPVCLQALIDMEARSAAAHVAPMLRNENPDVRLLALRFIGKFESAEHAPLVSKLHDDPAPKVRAAARDLMSRWRVTAAGGGVVAVPMLDRLLIQLGKNEGDDLIIASGRPVFMKKVGRVSAITDAPLTEEQVKSLLQPHLSTEQVMALQALQDVDYSHEVKSEGLRFRLPPAGRALGGIPAHPRVAAGDREAGPARAGADLRVDQARAGAGGRADRLGQVHHARRADRLHQPDLVAAHHLPRGSD
jgi:HEAT repeat protein